MMNWDEYAPLDEAGKASIVAEATKRGQQFGISKEQALYNYARENNISNANVDRLMGFGSGSTDTWVQQRDAAMATQQPTTVAAQPAPQGHAQAPYREEVTTQAKARAAASGKSAEQELWDYAKSQGIDAAGIDKYMGWDNGTSQAWAVQNGQMAAPNSGGGGGTAQTKKYQPLDAATRETVIAEARRIAKAQGISPERALHNYALDNHIDNAGIDTMMGFAPGSSQSWFDANSNVGGNAKLGGGGQGSLTDEWNANQYPWLRNQLNEATGRAQAAGGQMMVNGTGAMSDYESVFRPNYQKLNDFIGRYNDPAYLAQQRSQVMEGAQAQFDSQDDALRRRMQGMGVGSGAVADALASQASARAMAKVNAATNSDRELGKTYGDALAGMTGLGLKVADLGNNSLKNSVSSYAAPLTWGNDAFKTGGALRAIDSDANYKENATKLGLLDADMKDYNNRQGAGVNWYNAESNRIQANSGKLNSETNQSSVNEQNNFGHTLLGAGVSGIARSIADSWSKPSSSGSIFGLP